MTMVSREKLSCPGCGHNQKTAIWSTVNVTLDPDLRKQLFDCEVNVFSCEKCGKKAFIDVPLMYHDMTLGFCVQYYPPDSLEEASFFSLFAADGSCLPEDIPDNMRSAAPHLASPHIVFRMGEMINYIRFREGLHAASSGDSTTENAND